MTKPIMIILLLILLTAQLSASAQKPISEVDHTTFARQIVVNKTSTDLIELSMWMPTVFWKIIASNSPAISPDDVKYLAAALDDYVIICVVKGRIDPTGKIATLSESVLRKNVTLLADGKIFTPLAYDKLNTEAQQSKDIFEPIFAKILGDLGNGITVLYFNVKDQNGRNIIDPYRKGAFTINLDGTPLKYNLPIPSLFEDKICPNDQAAFPANYTYCPFHANELLEQ